MTARPVRVLVVGPHSLARRRLRAQFEQAGCTLCAEARDPAEAVAAALREHPDVCVVDVADADDVLATVTAISCRTHASVVVHGPDPSDDDLLASLAAGASGYVRSGTHPAGSGPRFAISWAADRRSPAAWIRCSWRPCTTPLRSPGDRLAPEREGPPPEDPRTEGDPMSSIDATQLHGPEHVKVYLDTDGDVGHEWRNGTSTLILTTKGRRSGEERLNALIYGMAGDNPVIVAS